MSQSPQPSPEAANLDTPSQPYPGFMPPGADLAAILARTTPAEAYILLALIAHAEPTGEAGRLITDRTTSELAEAVGMSRDTVDRALNGDPTRTPRGGLTTAGLVTDAGNRGRRQLRGIALPMHGQTPTTATKKPGPFNIIYNTAANMPRHPSGNHAAPPLTSAATVPHAQKTRAATVPHESPEARQNRRAEPPAFKPTPKSSSKDKDQQQQQARGSGGASSAPEVCNSRADTDAAREALTPELAQPVAERLAHIVPLPVIRAAIARANTQAKGRGFKTSRRDYVHYLLNSAEFHAEALADAQAQAARAAAVTVRTEAAQRTRHKQAAAALDEAAQAQADAERETAELNQIIEDMADERIAAIVAEIIAADGLWRLAARHRDGIRAAVRRPGLRGAFITRVRLIEAGTPRTVDAIE